MTYITADGPAPEVHDLIEKNGGKVRDERTWGKRQLVHPIRKQTHGSFTTIQFELDPEKIMELNRRLLLSDQVLRHLILASPAFKAVATSTKIAERAEKPIEEAREKMQPAAKTAPVKTKTQEKEKMKPTKEEALAETERQKKLEEELKKILEA